MGYTKEVKERSFDLIPEGWYTVKLLDVTPKTVGQGTKLKWKFEIVEGEFATRWVWGECWDNLDQSDGCVWRRWHEALVERDVEIGENIDTADVENYMCQVYVSHRSYEKDGEEKWVAEVKDDPESLISISAEIPSDQPQAVMAGAGADDDKPPY